MFKSKLVFPAACLGMLLFGISLISLGSVAPAISIKFQLDKIAAGSLFSLVPFGILAGSLIFGPVCDRYGYKTLLVLSCLLLAGGLQAIAFVSSQSLLKLFVFFFGLAGGVINGATNAVVSDISSTNKKARLSLLGVFFAIGALGMPVVLGLTENRYNFEAIVSAAGILPVLTAGFFLLVTFPPAKQAKSLPLKKSISVWKDHVLVLIAFFLFCQSSFEGIINNWTTTYLLSQFPVTQSKALYALSLYVAGMAVMRLLIGSVFKQFSSKKTLYISFVLLSIGAVLLKVAPVLVLAVSGLVILGAGLAAGFPVMLGFVGNRMADVSGTAFSFVLVIALLGNMLVNYLMGVLANAYGISTLTTLIFIEILAMIILSSRILKGLSISNKQYETNDVIETMA